MLKKLYLSPLGIVISVILNFFKKFTTPFMVYGYFDKVSGQFRKHTRVSSNAVMGDKSNIAVADHVWIWHHSILDGSNGIKIGEGCQIGAWVGIFSHGSQISIRLYGQKYIEIPREERLGYTRGPVVIGDYCFIGANSLIMPGVELGKGCLVAAGSMVTSSAPDYSILRGVPAKVVGDTRKLDFKYFDDPVVRENYYDKAALQAFQDAVSS